MSVEVVTRDTTTLDETLLEEMLGLGGAFGPAELAGAKEAWVLCASARVEGRLHGVLFSTLERIGGTPCVLIGLATVKRTSKRDQVLRALMSEAYHRALMAFPDEDVVVGSRFSAADGLEAFRSLDDLIPRHGHRAVGEERAWGRRLAKRFGVEATYDEKTFVVGEKGRSGFIDHESSKPENIDADLVSLFSGVNPKKGAVLVVHGWTMAEDLAKLGARH